MKSRFCVIIHTLFNSASKQSFYKAAILRQHVIKTFNCLMTIGNYYFSITCNYCYYHFGMLLTGCRRQVEIFLQLLIDLCTKLDGDCLFIFTFICLTNKFKSNTFSRNIQIKIGKLQYILFSLKFLNISSPPPPHTLK